MKKYVNLIILITFILCLGISIYNLYEVSLHKITQQKGFTITNQADKSIEITIDKNKLPINADFVQGTSLAKNDIICYQTDTTTMYLESIKYANANTEYLSINFNFYYTLPKEKGKIILPYDVIIKDSGFSYSYGVNLLLKQANDISKVYKNAISLHGTGPSEQFSIYLKSDVFSEAESKISFTVDGFNELSYIRK